MEPFDRDAGPPSVHDAGRGILSVPVQACLRVAWRRMSISSPHYLYKLDLRLKHSLASPPQAILMPEDRIMSQAESVERKGAEASKGTLTRRTMTAVGIPSVPTDFPESDSDDVRLALALFRFRYPVVQA